MQLRNFTPLRVTIAVCLLTLLGMWINVLPIPLNGAHQWRQADTLVTGYYFFNEETNIGYPKVAARNGTDGVAIGEFPLYSYIIGMTARAIGEWSEVTPKIINAFFFLLAFVSWGAFLRRKFGYTENDWMFWTLAFVATPLSLVYLTIPMPESIALACFGGAAWLWTRPFEKKKSLQTLKEFSPTDIIAAALFILGFVIRPYHIWLLFVIAPNIYQMAVVLVLCCASFFGWYRWWAGQATTLHGYFGIGFESPSAVLSALPKAFQSIPKRLIDQTLIIGLWPLWRGIKQAPLWGLGFFASWGTMMLLKPTHIPAHPYYLMNAGIFASVLMYLGMRTFSITTANIFGVIFIITSFVTVQHQFRPNREWPQIEALVNQVASQSDETDRVASYLGVNPKWHYFIKRRGSMHEPIEYQGVAHCPYDAKYFLYQNSEGAFVFAMCENQSVGETKQ